MALKIDTYAKAIHEHRALCEGAALLGRALHAPEIVLNSAAPFGTVAGRQAVESLFWQPLLSAFPDLERRTGILLSGQFRGQDWFASTGLMIGHFIGPLFGMKPTGRPQSLRYGWFDRVDDDRIVESYVIFDFARLMIDTGQWPLAPPLGADWWPAPATQDGLIRAAGTATVEESQKSLKLVESMIGGLMKYDGQSLSSMGMRSFWTPQFQWYGPGAIGSARGHADYERAHQRPFLAAFPDRVGGNHKCRIGDGPYVASTGWPSIHATHSGSGWLGMPPTGRRISMRVMDFWRREGDLLAENWVFIDLIDLLGQIGVDVWERLAECRR